MSSLRNSIQRRNHKERAQPLERKRLGLLEKHKVRDDYSRLSDPEIILMKSLLWNFY